MAERIDVHMRQTDAFAWYMEDDPLLRSTIVAVALLDGVPDWDIVMERIDRCTRVVPSLRQHIVSPPMKLATPRWAFDPDFDLSWHVRRMTAPTPGDLNTVLEFGRKTGMAGFDRARPLWNAWVMDGLEGGRTALVIKIHHSLTDGIGGIQLALNLFDFESDAPDKGPMPPEPEGEDLGSFDLLRDSIAYDWTRIFETARERSGQALPSAVQAIRHPFKAASEAIRTAQSIGKFVSPVTETLSPVMQERKHSWHYDLLDVGLGDLKRAAKSVDGTLNDAFMAGVIGGLRHYHRHHGAEADELRVTLPISLRKDDDPEGGNRITLVRFKVPAGIDNPADQMRAVDEVTTAWRNEPSLPLSNAIAGALNLLPRGVTGSMLKHVDFVASNVPGFPVPVYFAGARLLAYYPFGPTIGSSVNVTLMSYCDTCNIGVNMDAGAVPDAEVMMRSMRQGFEDVLDLAGDHKPARLSLHES